ncbi:glutamate ABC transporter substrate-binding protein [Amycolatopsis nigrescens]|uniref:glutamate ABC transporter substrate-binding protein n=1 Tax=Amycolatopsis nigrescens TaxID=381445 RepID=UPI000376B1B6|nr:glutamate ABC transporter substrate-binding protein [Amycolatopsis nigrescens]
MAAIGVGVALTAMAGCGMPDPTPSANAQAPNAEGLLGKAPVASADELATSPTAQAIKQRGQLLVGGELNMPLLSQQNPTTGGNEGFDAALGKMLAKYIIGRPDAKIVNTTADTRAALLKINTVDVVIRIYTITPERAKEVAFAGPYLMSGQAIATLKTTNGIRKPADLNGKTVLAVSNTTSVAAIEQYAPNAKIQTYGTAPECLQALEQGQGVAYVHDLTLLAGAAALNDKIEVVGDPFTTDPYGIGLKHGDESFKKFIDDWLVKIESSGLWQQAWQQSLGTVVRGDPPTPPQIGSVEGS